MPLCSGLTQSADCMHGPQITHFQGTRALSRYRMARRGCAAALAWFSR